MPAVKRIPFDTKCRICGEAIKTIPQDRLNHRPDIIYVYRNAKMAKGKARHLFFHRKCYEKEQAEIKQENARKRRI